MKKINASHMFSVIVLPQSNRARASQLQDERESIFLFLRPSLTARQLQEVWYRIYLRPPSTAGTATTNTLLYLIPSMASPISTILAGSRW